MIKSPPLLHRRPSPLAGSLLLAAAALLASLAACTHLSEAPSHAASIAGEWILDPASSDDFDALLRQAVDAQDKKLRKRMRPISVGDHDVPPLGLLPPEDPELIHDRLAEQLRPGDTLKLEWLDGTLQLSANGEPARSFSPGRTASRIDVAGTGQISAGWKGDLFQLQTKYQGDVRVQTFSVDASGRLIVTLSVKSDAVNKLEVTSRYHRAS
ncbi:MAG: hypothetical protein ABSE43_03500 [Steroidobacteraceae bacterium]|jgi:hypothetical protein